ncbi:hypothetical protein HZB88_03210, partial [archaeon]|nr:hypothetical protein [archaeon]
MFNGSIDTKERRDREKIKVLGALKGIKATSLEELAQSFDKVKCRFKKGDVLLFYLGGRGVPPPIKPDLIKRGDNGKYIPSSRVESDVEDDFHYFEIEIGAGRHETLPVSKLEYILKKITNHKKEMKFICIFDFCYSGGFGKEIGNQNKEIAILTSSTDSSEIVLSRTYSFRSLVLSAMHNKKADSSKDDMITIGEAFNYAERKRAPYLEKHIKDIIHPPCWPEHRNRHTGRAYNLNTADFGIYKIR